MEAQLQQLAVNARCSPRGVLCSHTKDKRPDLLAQRLSATELPRPGEPVPIQAKASAMPLHDGSWRDQKKRCFPSRPKPSQKNPEQLVPHRSSRAATLGVQG